MRRGGDECFVVGVWVEDQGYSAMFGNDNWVVFDGLKIWCTEAV